MKYLTILLLLVGCYTPKKAAKQADKALREYPQIVGERFRKEFPCVTGRVDTLIEYETIARDTIIEIVDTKIDTIENSDTVILFKTIEKKITLPGKTVTITRNVKDSFEVFHCQLLLEESTLQKNQLIQDIAKRDKQISKLKSWRRWLIWPYIIFISYFILARIFRK